MTNKVFSLITGFKAFESEDKKLSIAGMASTSNIDRAGDVVSSEAWNKGGLDNFKQNPIILFNHNPNEPIGRADLVESVANGLSINVTISKAAGKIYELIKDGVLGAFSVSFLIKDADYIEETGGLRIKDAELLEVSVVSIPMNQAATFSLAKSFDSLDEYEEYKKTFTNSVDLAGQSLAKGEVNASRIASNTPDGALSSAQKEIKMDEAQKLAMEAIAAEAAEKAATKVAMDYAKRKAAEDAEKAEAVQKAEKAAAEKAAVTAAINSGIQTGAEKLVADLEKQLAAKDANMAEVLAKFKTDLEEKNAELTAMRESKMKFGDRSSGKSEKELIKENGKELMYASMLGVMTNKGWNTDYAKEILEKAGVNYTTNAGDLDQEIQDRIQKEITVHTKVAQLFREIPVNGASTVLPIQPDVGLAAWAIDAPSGNLENNPQGTANTYEAAQVFMNVYRLVSSSFLHNDTDEQVLINLMPMLVDGVARAHARAVERAILINGGSVQGLSTHATVGATTLAVGGLTAIDLLNARTQMGKYGLNPEDLTYIVNQDSYYALLADPEFQNMNEVGAMAIKVKGMVGAVYGTPVVVSDEFATVASTVAAAFVVHNQSYVIPRLRGIRVEQDYEVMNQRRVIVASQSLGFTELFAAAPASVRINYLYT